MATSKRVRNAAPLRQRFSLEVFFLEDDAPGVASSNAHGRWTADSTFRALPRNRCADWDHGLGPHFCWPPLCGSLPVPQLGLENPSTLERISPGVRAACYDSAKFAAVPHAMSKPASELLHFAYTVRQVWL